MLVIQSCLTLCATPWTVAHQAPLSLGFSRQDYWSGWPFPSSGDLPSPGIELESPALQADSSPSQPPGKPKGNRCDIYKFRGFGESSEALPFKHTSILTSYLLFEFNHQNLKETTFTYSTNIFNIFFTIIVLVVMQSLSRVRLLNPMDYSASVV